MSWSGSITVGNAVMTSDSTIGSNVAIVDALVTLVVVTVLLALLREDFLADGQLKNNDCESPQRGQGQAFNRTVSLVSSSEGMT